MVEGSQEGCVAGRAVTVTPGCWQGLSLPPAHLTGGEGAGQEQTAEGTPRSRDSSSQGRVERTREPWEGDSGGTGDTAVCPSTAGRRKTPVST